MERHGVTPDDSLAQSLRSLEQRIYRIEQLFSVSSKFKPTPYPHNNSLNIQGGELGRRYHVSRNQYRTIDALVGAVI
jgi:hypothetical protein